MASFSFIFTSNFVDFIPVLTVFAVAAVRLLPSATLIAHAVVCIRHNSNSVNKLYEDYVKPKPEDSQNGIENSPIIIDKFKELEMIGVNFSFDKKSGYILKDVGLKIKAGESIGIIGPSGSGKSTLADLLLGLLDPVQGSILINGIDISACKTSCKSS